MLFVDVIRLRRGPPFFDASRMRLTFPKRAYSRCTPTSGLSLQMALDTLRTSTEHKLHRGDLGVVDLIRVAGIPYVGLKKYFIIEHCCPLFY